jgi:hypothetical protein
VSPDTLFDPLGLGVRILPPSRESLHHTIKARDRQTACGFDPESFELFPPDGFRKSVVWNVADRRLTDL